MVEGHFTLIVESEGYLFGGLVQKHSFVKEYIVARRAAGGGYRQPSLAGGGLPHGEEQQVKSP